MSVRSPILNLPDEAIGIAVASGAVPPAKLGLLVQPSARHIRRALLLASVDGITGRQALRDAGWRRTEIRLWLRTGSLPERAS